MLSEAGSGGGLYPIVQTGRSKRWEYEQRIFPRELIARRPKADILQYPTYTTLPYLFTYLTYITPDLLTCPTYLTSHEATDHAIMSLYRQDIIGVQAIGHVLKAYEDPPHDWGKKTAWRLINAATFALAGKVAEKPDLTKHLHAVIDGTCASLH
jgi:hypothetical protein